MKQLHPTREGWLIEAVKKLDEEFFKGRGYDLPKKLGVSCGFPLGKRSAIGQCWDPEVCEDGTVHMFICPSIGEAVRVLDILLHEMIHAYCGIEAGHKGPFRKLVKEFGLMGKMTATYAEENTDLYNTLQVMAGTLGKYPHSALDKSRKKKPKVENKWVRYVSLNDETYKVVINRDKVEEFGIPKDPMGDDMVPAKKRGE